MRRWLCVPMMALCLLLGGCGDGEGDAPSQSAREPYQAMAGCSMTAEVTCDYGEQVMEFTLSCAYVPEEESVVEILAPETVAGVKARVRGDSLELEYEDVCLPAGTLSSQEISAADCLVRMMNALRDGWLLDQNREKWGDTDCLRLQLDQTGKEGGKILTTLWLRQEDGTPVHGELSVEDQIILQAEFTAFEFGDILKDGTESAGPAEEAAG